MANHQYVKIESGAAKPQKQSIPILYEGAGLLRTLERLGFEIPEVLTKVAAERRPLGVAECQIDYHDLDERLKLFNVTLDQKFHLKAALTNAGLMR